MISDQYIIGTLLFGSEDLKYIPITNVRPHQINHTYSRIIFETCLKANQKFENVSVDVVDDLLGDDLNAEFFEDYKEYVCTTRTEIEGHCRHVTDNHAKKAILDGLNKIVLKEFGTSKELVTEAEQVLNMVADDVGIPGLTYSQMIERDKNSPRYQKLETGDPFWDRTFFRHCGMHKGQMTTVFGDSKHGKSMAAMLFSRLLIDSGYKGLYTSFEDRDIKYANHIRKGLQHKALIDNLIVTDHSQGCSTLEDIITTTKYHKAANDIAFLVVDNAQIVEVNGVNNWDETKKLVVVSPALSRMAIELDIWVLLLSQITNSRSGEHGYRRQPKIHDIYGSGQIRKDSFMGISVFKPSEVEELLVKNEFNGDIRGVKHPNGNGEIWPSSTVLLKQELIREGEKYWKNVIANITETGVKRPANDTPKQPEEPF